MHSQLLRIFSDFKIFFQNWVNQQKMFYSHETSICGNSRQFFAQIVKISCCVCLSSSNFLFIIIYFQCSTYLWGDVFINFVSGLVSEQQCCQLFQNLQLDNFEHENGYFWHWKWHFYIWHWHISTKTSERVGNTDLVKKEEEAFPIMGWVSSSSLTSKVQYIGTPGPGVV